MNPPLKASIAPGPPTPRQRDSTTPRLLKRSGRDPPPWLPAKLFRWPAQRLTGGHYCALSWKNRLPDREPVIVMDLFVPSLETPALGVQLAKSELCYKVKPVKEAGQERVRPPADGVSANAGVAELPDALGLASRPRKRTLPVCVSRIRNRNG